MIIFTGTMSRPDVIMDDVKGKLSDRTMEMPGKCRSPNGLSPWQHSTCAVFMTAGNASTGQQETIPNILPAQLHLFLHQNCVHHES